MRSKVEEIYDRFNKGKDTQQDVQYLFHYIGQLEHMLQEIEENIPQEIIEENLKLRKNVLIKDAVISTALNDFANDKYNEALDKLEAIL